MVNNMDWYGKMDLCTYLRDVGKQFRVNSMLNKVGEGGKRMSKRKEGEEERRESGGEEEVKDVESGERNFLFMVETFLLSFPTTLVTLVPFTHTHTCAQESVNARLNSDVGMSFTEFSYQTLQAYDFWKLSGE